MDGDRERIVGPPRDWLDDLDDPPRRTPGRSRRLWVLAGLPWLVALAALVLPGVPASDAPEPATVGQPDPGAAPDGEDPGPAPGDAADPHADAPVAPDHAGDGAHAGSPDDPLTGADVAAPGGTAADGQGPSDHPAGASPPADDPADRDELWAVEYHGPWRSTAGVEEAAALAVVVARGWLTDVDPRLHLDELTPVGTGRYVEHLVVEAVEVPAPEHAVVTLLAVLLDGDDELVARVRRLGVPIAFGRDGAQPGGEPWWLPGPSLTARPPTTTPVDDPQELLAASEALAAAGYTDVALDRLERTDGPAALATVAARTPDGEQVDGTVWLRWHVDRYVVAGLALTRAEVAP